MPAPYYVITNTLDGPITGLPGIATLAVGANNLLQSDWLAIRTSPAIREAMQRGIITVANTVGAAVTATAVPVTALKGGSSTTVYSAYTLSDGP